MHGDHCLSHAVADCRVVLHSRKSLNSAGSKWPGRVVFPSSAVISLTPSGVYARKSFEAEEMAADGDHVGVLLDSYGSGEVDAMWSKTVRHEAAGVGSHRGWSCLLNRTGREPDCEAGLIR